MQNLACCCCLQVAYKEVSPLFLQKAVICSSWANPVLWGLLAHLLQGVGPWPSKRLWSLLVALCEGEMGFALNECLPGWPSRGCCGAMLWCLFSRMLLTADLFVLPRKGWRRALIIWATSLHDMLLLEMLPFKQTCPKCTTCVGDSAARDFCQLWWSVLHSAAS